MIWLAIGGEKPHWLVVGVCECGEMMNCHSVWEVVHWAGVSLCVLVVRLCGDVKVDHSPVVKRVKALLL